MIDRYTPVTLERNASQPNTERQQARHHHHQQRKPEHVEPVPIPGQFLPIQEHHEIGQQRIAVDPARPDLAHEVHADGIPPSAKNANDRGSECRNSPRQVDRQGKHGVGHVLAQQRHRIVETCSADIAAEFRAPQIADAAEHHHHEGIDDVTLPEIGPTLVS
jgi:hypothetical protein